MPREISKKNRAVREAWEDGAEVQWRGSVSDPWRDSCMPGTSASPYFAAPGVEWRIKPAAPRRKPNAESRFVHYMANLAGDTACGLKWDEYRHCGEWESVSCIPCLKYKPEERRIIHFMRSQYEERAACGTQFEPPLSPTDEAWSCDWARINCPQCLKHRPEPRVVHFGDGPMKRPICTCGQNTSDVWHEVTCSACLKHQSEPSSAVHFVGHGKIQSECGIIPVSYQDRSWDWNVVTCPKCLALKPKPTGTKKIEPPEGWRLVQDDEPLLPGDMGHEPEDGPKCLLSVPGKWAPLLLVPDPVSHSRVAFSAMDAFARKLPERLQTQIAPSPFTDRPPLPNVDSLRNCLHRIARVDYSSSASTAPSVSDLRAVADHLVDAIAAIVEHLKA